MARACPGSSGLSTWGVPPPAPNQGWGRSTTAKQGEGRRAGEWMDRVREAVSPATKGEVSPKATEKRQGAGGAPSPHPKATSKARPKAQVHPFPHRREGEW